jgi:hypothetical protein
MSFIPGNQLSRGADAIQDIQAGTIRRLRVDAERCFRLAHGVAAWRLADELEAMGHALQRQAQDLERQSDHDRQNQI